MHDYAGYAFPVELSRELAGRGHHVLHLYCADLVGARGELDVQPDDPPTLSIEGVGIGHPFEKYSFARRLADELAYGRRTAERVAAFGPRAVLSANTPLLSQQRLLAESRRNHRRFVYWWQDSYGVGFREVVRRRSPMIASATAWLVEALERRLLKRSDHVVAISEGLRDHARRWGVDLRHVDVIANWAPLDEITPAPSDNGWKHAHHLAGAPLVLYAGTLGLKHNPELLVTLAAKLGDMGARLAVVSQGPGRQVLEQRRRELDLENLVLLDYQPQEQLSEVLSSADVLVAILEPGAAAFSVPSKVFSYLCAGRPVVASIPPGNQAAEVIRSADAGVVVPPEDAEAFAGAVVGLLADPETRQRLGDNGRRYALSHFAPGPIGDRFERVLAGPRGASQRLGPVGVAASTVARIWSHPENRHRRLRALAAYGAWQVWERSIRRPWTVPLTATRRIRCYPHSPVTSSVLYYRLPDPMEMRFLLDFLEEGDLFVDVGAHVGVYSVLASSVPGVRVIALEPSSGSFARLRENVEVNGIEHLVTTRRVAVGDRVGDVRLATGLDSMNAVVDGDESSESVPMTTLDRLLAGLDHGTAAVKVDVEGAELEVLAGAGEAIEQHRPALVVEVNDADRLASFARRSGYNCVRYDPGRRLLAPADVESFDGRNALLVADLDEALRRLRG